MRPAASAGLHPVVPVLRHVARESIAKRGPDVNRPWWVVRASRGVLRRLRRAPCQGEQIKVRMERLGSAYGGYCVCPVGLREQTVVYSFGVGKDVSFDLALIERFGVTVHAFDPTPQSIDWARSQALPPQFVLHEYGIGDHDGTARLIPPSNPEHVSHRVAHQGDESRPTVELPIRRLATVLRALGHSHIDLLKLDVEGAEYSVIDEIVEKQIDVAQLVLEFHHQLTGYSLHDTETAISKLDRAGYQVFHVSRTGREYSFLRRPGA